MKDIFHFFINHSKIDYKASFNFVKERNLNILNIIRLDKINIKIYMIEELILESSDIIN